MQDDSSIEEQQVMQILHRTGSRWSMRVMYALNGSVLRFNELRGHMPGVSQRSLSLELHALERDGFLTRTVFPEIPPRVEYELLPRGRSLLHALEPLLDWCRANADDISISQKDYDARPTQSNGSHDS